ncbi:MAG: TraR/DksA family transcriptional regulator [Gammaproteobacteria bacterium]|nr:TraR/DksA family transcriptional regulator [Gammaproteobacteria bacterium]MBL6999675.1 TraR/DksA family transcriptional regulator [Gammaproteobacteria bacterium]
MHTNVDPFKHKLLALKQEVTQRIGAIDKEIRHEGMSADWAEQATERENDEVLESLGNTSTVELLKINQALRRIDDGEYFYCSHCGEEIPPARLQLLPYSTHCVRCAEKLEQT